MVVICTTEVGRSEHAALGPLAHLPADLQALAAGRASVFEQPLGARTFMNAPRGAPHAVRGAPRRAPGDASERFQNENLFQSLWMPAARKQVRPRPPSQEEAVVESTGRRSRRQPKLTGARERQQAAADLVRRQPIARSQTRRCYQRARKGGSSSPQHPRRAALHASREPHG